MPREASLVGRSRRAAWTEVSRLAGERRDRPARADGLSAVDLGAFDVRSGVPGRGFQPAQVAWLTRLQGTQGNYAVQRYLAQARRETKPAGDTGRTGVAPAMAAHSMAAPGAFPARIQRDLDLDNPDFSGNIKMAKLGGNAEGAFLFSEGSQNLVVKPADAPDRTVLSYNLAKDFQVDVPKARFLTLESPQGKILLQKAAGKEGGNAELAGALEKSKGVILMEYIEGKTLGKHKNASVESAEVQQFQSNKENLAKIGRMVVFDAAILNSDRFKLEFGGEANSGNLLVGKAGPMALDQDFAKIGEEDALEDYKDQFVKKLKPLLADPAKLAIALVAKMEREGYALLTGGEKLIEEGVRQGIEILGGLAAKSNNRIEKLVEWAKTFVDASGLKSSPIREYW
ncbi:MAG: hypothetical protein ACRDIY_02050 [Chloroflexota bacterium]